jgi:peptidoglycan/xylan/chitin deacetylase (PgdA/CDA1 family)
MVQSPGVDRLAVNGVAADDLASAAPFGRPSFGSATEADLVADAVLAPSPSRLARARASLMRELAARAVPRSVLLVRGERRRCRKRIALTFDDGPDAWTPRYLDVLARLGVRATFFLVGENAARTPELAREYVARGHEVGGHGWSHEPFTTMSHGRLAIELGRTRAALPATGSRPLVRPPTGALSATALMHIASAGYTTVMWSLDSDDCRTVDPRAIERRLDPGRVSAGDIVLLHEMQPWTLEALPPAVRALRRAGWELVTVSELVG